MKISLFAGLAALAASSFAQTTTTLIQDNLSPAYGSTVSGSVTLSWTQFTYGGTTIAASPVAGRVSPIINGAFSVTLAPTDHVTAQVVYYTAVIRVGGQVLTTYWAVPTLPSAQCASSSFCTIKEVTVAYPSNPSATINPAQINTGSSSPGQFMCNVAGIAGWCTLNGVYSANYATLALACTAAVGGSQTIIVSTAWNAQPTQTCNASIEFVKGGMIQPANGATVTLRGPVTAPLSQQIFDLSAGGSIGHALNAPKISPVWFGADTTGVASATTAIQAAVFAAIQAAGTTVAGTVFLPCGSFGINPAVTVPTAFGLKIESAGTCTQLRALAALTDLILIQDNYQSTFSFGRINGTTSNLVTNAIHFINSGSGTRWPSSLNHLHHTDISASSGIANGIYWGGGTDGNNDQMRVEHVTVEGYTEACVKLDGTQAYDQVLEEVSCQANAGGQYGMEALSGSFHWKGGFMGGNYTDDFFVNSISAEATDTIEDTGSEGSSQFLATGGPGFFKIPITVKNVRWTDHCLGNTQSQMLAGCTVTTGGDAIRTQNEGPLSIYDSNFGGAGSGIPLTICFENVMGLLTPAQPNFFTVVNSSFDTSLTSPAALFHTGVGCVMPNSIRNNYSNNGGTTLLDIPDQFQSAAFAPSAPVTYAARTPIPVKGMLAQFTDSNVNTIGATVAGGGSNFVTAIYDGAKWVVLYGAGLIPPTFSTPGIVCDGTTDTGAAINTALGTAGVTRLPSSGAACITSAPIVMGTAHTKLIGGGPGLSIIKLTSGPAANAVSITSGDTSIEELTVDANSNAGNAIGTGTNGLSNVKINRVEAKNATGNGVQLVSASNASLTNSTLIGNATGQFDYQLAAGTTAANVTIDNNIMDPLSAGSTFVTLYGMQALTGSASSFNNMSITNNKVKYYSRSATETDGIVIGNNSTNTSTGITVANNQVISDGVASTGSNAIEVANPSAQVVGNSVQANFYAINVHSSSNDTTVIANNTLTCNATTCTGGGAVQANTGAGVATGNIIKSTTWSYGFNINTPGWVVSNNSIDCSSCAVFNLSTGATNTAITTNTILNATYGVLMSGTMSAINILGNMFASGVFYGIYDSASSHSSVLLQGNTYNGVNTPRTTTNHAGLIDLDDPIWLPAPTVDNSSCSGATIGASANNSVATITGIPASSCAVKITFSTTARNRWNCSASNLTHTGTANMFFPTIMNSTSCTFTGTGGSGGADVLYIGAQQN